MNALYDKRWVQQVSQQQIPAALYTHEELPKEKLVSELTKDIQQPKIFSKL